MDDRLLLFFWLVGSGAYFGLLGAGFGALAGNLSYESGRPTGTGIAQSVARNFERVNLRALTPSVRGTLVGAVDGFLFLACVGLAFGVIGYRYHLGAWEIAMAVLATLMLITMAVFFGSVGYLASQGGTGGVGALFIVTIPMGIIGFLFAQVEGLMMGLVGGIALGVLLWRGASRSHLTRNDPESTSSPDPEDAH